MTNEKEDIMKKMAKEAADKLEVKSENDLDLLLGLMAESGQLQESYDPKSGELQYKMTNEGENEAVELLKTEDGALMFFQTFMNMMKEEEPDPYKRMIECAVFLKKNVGVNLIRIIQRNAQGIKGIKLKKPFDKENFEEIARKFD